MGKHFEETQYIYCYSLFIPVTSRVKGYIVFGEKCVTSRNKRF